MTQGYADLEKDLLWRHDQTYCKGTFLPLEHDLIALPEDKTSIETAGKSQLAIGKGAKLNNVTVRQNNIKLFSARSSLKLDKNNKIEMIDFLGKTSYQSPRFLINASKGRFDLPSDQLVLQNTSYRLDSVAGSVWGQGEDLYRDSQRKYTFHNVTLSYCPPQHETWSAAAETMRYLPDQQLVKLYNPSFRWMGNDLFKIPFISFPTSGRHSGLLRPDIGFTKEYGFKIKQPIYFNLAPNYDLVLAPLIYDQGTMGLNGVGRYLTKATEGELRTEVLWDNLTNKKRYQAQLLNHYKLTNQTHIDAEVIKFSDSDWFRDFGNTFNIIDTLHPLEKIAVGHAADWGTMSLEAIKFRNNFVADSSTIPDKQVLTILPKTWNAISGLNFNSIFEAGHYYHIQDSNQGSFGSSINRLIANLKLGYEVKRPYGYWQSRIDETLRYYNSSDVFTAKDAIPSVATEAGMFFEKRTPSYYQTLTPKLAYVYVPYHSQADLPIIDTSEKANTDMSDLFSQRRFLGWDRIGDQNAFVVGVSSRIYQPKQSLGVELGKQVNITSPKLCLNSACTDQTSSYNPLFISVDGENEYGHLKGGGSYDMSLHAFRNINASVKREDFLDSDWELLYAYDARQSADSTGTQTDPLSRLGARQIWHVNDLFTLDASVIKDFRGSGFLSYQLGTQFDSCCWSSKVFIGRRYIGVNDAAATNDDYQWYGAFEFFLKGFSDRPILKLGENKQEILETLNTD